MSMSMPRASRFGLSGAAVAGRRIAGRRARLQDRIGGVSRASAGAGQCCCGFKRFTGSSQKLGVASTFSGASSSRWRSGHMVPEAAEAFGEGGAAGGLPLDAGRPFTDLGRRAPANGAEAPSSDLSASDAAAGAAVGAAPPAAAQTSGSAAMLLGALSVPMLETMAGQWRGRSPPRC